MEKKGLFRIGVLVVLGIFLLMSLTTVASADAEWTQTGAVVHLTTVGDLVGIGTSTPSHKLQISDTSTTANRAGLYVAQSGAVSGTGYGIYATKTGASTTNVGGYFSATGATNNYGLIIENGYVGIGTTSPECDFDITSSAVLGTKLELHNTDTGGDRWQIISKGSSNPGVAGDLMFYDVTSSIVGPVFTWDGKVGIGTAVPGALLEIATTSGDPYLGFDIAGTDKFMIGVDDSDGDKLKIGTSLIDTDTRLTIDSLGKIGIGETSPSYILDVKATSSVGATSFTGTGLDDMTSGGTFTGATALNYIVEIDGTGTPDTFMWDDDGELVIDTKGTAVPTSTSPTSLNNGVTVTFGASTGHTLTDYWTFSTTVTNPFSIQNAAGTRVFYVGNDGNVGIGTTSPGSVLSIVGLPTSNTGLSTGDLFTQTALQIGGSGATKVVCVK